jgi:hypothetical protein
MELHVFVVGELEDAKSNLGKGWKAKMSPRGSDRFIPLPLFEQHTILQVCEKCLLVDLSASGVVSSVSRAE